MPQFAFGAAHLERLEAAWHQLSAQPAASGAGMQWCTCPAGEGPVGLIVCPSRELARQTHEVIEGYTNELRAREGKQLNTLLCIGGIDTKAQTDK